jgi:hypothetical protein
LSLFSGASSALLIPVATGQLTVGTATRVFLVVAVAAPLLALLWEVIRLALTPESRPD